METSELKQFIDQWTTDGAGTRDAFITFRDHLESMPDAVLSFKARPGISYSLRAARPGQQRELFVMVDVIDDDPDNRWLSVCFYGEMITDPDELGDLIPGGLLGEDGYCFDLNESDDAMAAYLQKRMDEAYQAAAA
ncbi:MAG: hypothetical protein SWC96_05820 [Thermodesulfobacteriota bacterium]|nr:hypothetical protein [Thermodesulfobacteriota bacterium]